MNRTPAEKIVEFLSFSREGTGCLSTLHNLNPRGMEHVLRWLDDSGLAFYLLQKLKDANATDAIPNSILSRLEQNFAANRQRVADMLSRFDSLNEKFNAAGVRYAVVKGISLVPQFCPDANLRYQGDFDYLVDSESLPLAQSLLLKAGYIQKPSLSALESIFVLPGTTPSRTNHYSPLASHAVELHLDMWDAQMHGLPSLPPLLSVDRAVMQRRNEFTFLALREEDAFLLQILHACHHLFTHWIRMSSLFEIGYFLNRRAADAALWDRVEERVGDNLVLREFLVVITELVMRLFSAPLPSIVNAWGAEIRPGPRVWIEKYSRDWAFCDLPVYEFSLFPNAKLSRLLHRQYRDAQLSSKAAVRTEMPPSRPARMIASLKKNPSLALNADWWKRQLVIRRTLFHTMAALRYFCEIPRWWWLNRTKMRSASPNM